MKRGAHATVDPGPPLTGRHQASVSIGHEGVDLASGSFAVRLYLPNPSAKSRPG